MGDVRYLHHHGIYSFEMAGVKILAMALRFKKKDQTVMLVDADKSVYENIPLADLSEVKGEDYMKKAIIN